MDYQRRDLLLRCQRSPTRESSLVGLLAPQGTDDHQEDLMVVAVCGSGHVMAGSDMAR